MTASDIIAVYGALLATGLAVVQIMQWKASNKKVAIDVYDEFSSPPSHLDITLTNMSASQIYIKFAGIGISYRPWVMPWSIRRHELIGLSLSEDGLLTGKGVEQPLSPGEMLETYASDETYRLLVRPRFWKGWDWRWTIEVDHSLSRNSERRRMNWSVAWLKNRPVR